MLVKKITVDFLLKGMCNTSQQTATFLTSSRLSFPGSNFEENEDKLIKIKNLVHDSYGNMESFKEVKKDVTPIRITDMNAVKYLDENFKSATIPDSRNASVRFAIADDKAVYEGVAKKLGYKTIAGFQR